MDSSKTHTMGNTPQTHRSKNPFGDVHDDLDFDITLQFRFMNPFGTEVYQDPLHRYAFKTAEYMTPFELSPQVNYQGDLYVGRDGARYQVTNNPHSIDPYGVLRAPSGSTETSQ